MKTIELKQLIDEYNHKLDTHIHLNKKAVYKNIQLKKSQKNTSMLLLNRIVELLSLSFIVLYMSNFIANHWGEIHFVISGVLIIMFAIIALIGSIGQIVLIKQIDYTKPILEISKKIETINTHGFLFIKLLLLSMSVWWIYAIAGLYLFFGIDIYPHLNPGFVRIYLIANGLLIIPLLYCFYKLSYKNLHIKWVRLCINGITSRNTKKALSFLNNIEAFKG